MYIVTSDIKGPFEIRQKACVLRPNIDAEMLTGPIVEIASIDVDSNQVQAMKMVDSSGVTPSGQSSIYAHGTDLQTMWVSEKGKKTGSIQFNLNSVSNLDIIKIWNYNSVSGAPGISIIRADISVWTETGGWKKIIDDQRFIEGPGQKGYNWPAIVKLGGVKASRVRIDDIVNAGGESIGLSEVKIYKSRGAFAIRPKPVAGGSLNSKVAILKWIAGFNTVKHKVFLGEDPQELKLIDTTDKPEVNISEIVKAGKWYYWRIDEVLPDGQIATGPVWYFNTGDIIGSWAFDETTGLIASDMGRFGFDARLEGGLSFDNDSVKGHDAQAIKLDGKDDYIAIPPMNITGSNMTITSWVKLEGKQMFFAGIVFSRGKGTIAGMSINSNNELRYHWNDQYWSFRTGLIIPESKWVFVALAVSPEKATLYLHDGNDMKSVMNTSVHEQQSFADITCIGLDKTNEERRFKGCIDNVTIYTTALDKDDLMRVYQGDGLKPIGEAKVIPVFESKLLSPSDKEIHAEGKKGDKNNMIIVIVIVTIIAGIVLITRKNK